MIESLERYMTSSRLPRRNEVKAGAMPQRVKPASQTVKPGQSWSNQKILWIDATGRVDGDKSPAESGDKSPHSEGNIRTGWCGVRRLVAAFGAGDLSPEAECPPHEPLERSRLLTPALSSFEEERETDKCVMVQGFNA